MGDPNTRLGADRITSHTQSGRAPWEEMLGKYPATPAARSIQAASAVQGMAGSWAGSWTLQPTGIMNDTMAEAPAPLQVIPNQLGRMGLPEINFVPYSANTNRIGNKGASLVGCPISYSVIGPTIKNRRTIWQWLVENNKAVTDPDVLTLDTVAAIDVSGVGTPGLASFDPLTRGIQELYGIDPATWEDDYPGGLYVIVSMTGTEGALGGTFAAAGGVGDGFINTVGGGEACAPLEVLSPYEIFRIAAFDDASIILDQGKQLSDYFSIPVLPDLAVIRSITIVTPAASRCVVLPGSEDKTFAILPPARALGSDQQYPRDDFTGGTWVEELTSWSNAMGPNVYDEGPLLPVPKPITFMNGKLDGGGGVGPSLTVFIAGTMNIYIEDTDHTDYTGKIFCIRGATVKGNAELVHDPVTGFQAGLGSLLGYYEVLFQPGASGDWRGWALRRIDEADPVTGRSLFGCDRMFELQTPTVAGDEIFLDVSIHEPVSSIWMSAAFDYDAVDSARIKNLLDPRWIERSTKTIDGWPGTFPNKAEKAVFDTATNGPHNSVNPGNLYDMGFKVVLYAAEIDGNGNIAPKWSHPVAANDMVLGDGTDGESFVEVDYANGLIRLSESPENSDSPLQMGTGVDVHADNPRGEFIIFACCVPYTLEAGQTGTGSRVTGSYSSSVSGACASGSGVAGSPDFADVYGGRTMIPLEDGPNIQSWYDGGTASAITLEGYHAADIPQAGFVEILQGETPFGTPNFADEDVRAATWGYFGTRERLSGGTDPVTDLLNPFGGGVYGVSSFLASGHKAILRRHTSPAWGATGTMLTDYQYDTTYGQAARGSTLRFDGAEVVHNLDGSVTVRMRDTGVQDNVDNFGDLFSSWILEGGVPTFTVAGLNVRATYTEMTVLVRGQRFTIPPGYVQFAPPAAPYAKYLYVDTSAACPTMAMSDTLPLTTGDYSKDHILISKCYDLGAGPLVHDLRYPLVDVDQRVDIYVGQTENMEADTPHFTSLADAVAYASEIQNPDAGNPGRRVHIKVVGYTDEADANLPIQIKSDGIIITGSPQLMQSTEKMEVRWDSVDKALIDFNGHHDTLIQNVPFRSTLDEVTYPPGSPGRDRATADRVLFINTGATCERVHVKNCRLRGPSQGFLAVVSATHGDGSFEESRFEDNNAIGVLDFGFYVTVGSVAIGGNNVFAHNYIEQDGANPGAMQALSEGGGIWFTRAGIGASAFNHITHNYMVGFYQGICLDSIYGLVDFNIVGSTQGRGYLIDGSATVSNNAGINVHIAVGAPRKEAMSCTNFTGTVQNNDLALASAVAGDLELYVQSTYTKVAVRDNYALRTEVDGPSMLVEGHYAEDLSVLGSRTRVVNSTIEEIVVGAGVSYCYIGGCHWTGTPPAMTIQLSASSNHCVVEGCHGLLLAANGTDVAVNDSTFTTGQLFGIDARVSNSYFTTAQLFANNARMSNCAVGTLEAGYRVSDNTFIATGHQISNTEVSGTAYLGEECRAENSRFESLTYLATGCSVQGSHIADLRDYNLIFSGTWHPAVGVVLEGNTVAEVEGGTFVFRCSRSTFMGNQFLTSLKIESQATPYLGFRHIVQGNQFTTGSLAVGSGPQPAIESVVSENTLQVDLKTYGDDSRVFGNHISGNMAVYGDGLHVSGNKAQNAAVRHDVVGVSCVVRGNDITGALRVGPAGKTTGPNLVADNQVSLNLECSDPNGTVTGNRCGSLTVDSTSEVTGNSSNGQINVNTGSIVTGNSAAGDITVAADSILTGNNTATDLVVGIDSTVQGNIVGDDMLFSVNAAGCVIMGNKVVGNIGAAGLISTAIVMGNRAAAVFGVAGLVVGPKDQEAAVAGTPFNIVN